jgi:hypothetical protein
MKKNGKNRRYPVSDEVLKDLTNEILEDRTVTADEKRDQLKKILELNDLSNNQIAKINRLIGNLSVTGYSFGSALIEADKLMGDFD